MWPVAQGQRVVDIEEAMVRQLTQQVVGTARELIILPGLRAAQRILEEVVTAEEVVAVLMERPERRAVA